MLFLFWFPTVHLSGCPQQFQSHIIFFMSPDWPQAGPSRIKTQVGAYSVASKAISNSAMLICPLVLNKDLPAHWYYKYYAKIYEEHRHGQAMVSALRKFRYRLGKNETCEIKETCRWALVG